MLRRFATFYRLKINVSKLCHALVSEGDSSWTLSNDRTERENRRQLDRPADSSYATGNKVFLLSTRAFCGRQLFDRTRIPFAINWGKLLSFLDWFGVSRVPLRNLIIELRMWFLECFHISYFFLIILVALGWAFLHLVSLYMFVEIFCILNFVALFGIYLRNYSLIACKF